MKRELGLRGWFDDQKSFIESQLWDRMLNKRTFAIVGFIARFILGPMKSVVVDLGLWVIGLWLVMVERKVFNGSWLQFAAYVGGSNTNYHVN